MKFSAEDITLEPLAGRGKIAIDFGGAMRSRGSDEAWLGLADARQLALDILAVVMRTEAEMETLTSPSGIVHWGKRPPADPGDGDLWIPTS